MDGIFNIYKEKGFTSHDVVAIVRRTIHMKKVGHTGTLDPDAEGAAVMQEMSATGKLEADTEEKLKNALESYTENFINTRPAK